MSKEDQKIIVVKKDILLGNDYFQGFIPNSKINYESRILSNLEIMKRGDAEQDDSYKQPIGYATIINPKYKTIFAYQRSSKDKDYGEKRLQGKWSWGVGGHIESFDLENKNPIRESMIREVTNEEVEIIGEIINSRALGYINDDSDNVGKVHFGIIYLLETNGDVRPKDLEISQGKLMNLEELDKICASPNCEVENWSMIALDPLKNYFKNR